MTPGVQQGLVLCMLGHGLTSAARLITVAAASASTCKEFHLQYCNAAQPALLMTAVVCCVLAAGSAGSEDLGLVYQTDTDASVLTAIR